MEFLQNVDVGTLLIIAVGLIGLCVVGLLLMFGLQVIGSSLAAISGIFDLIGGVLGGGPAAWCGCLVLLLMCGGCAAVVWIVTTCNSNPTAMNFCTLLR
ncbi:MAG: hypothetical protein JNJ61_21600 [Anaerolineae bacterium]|nr:hypothetical protein [Anaerolineae bacterium]